jgi:serine/alanine adding enzyme
VKTEVFYNKEINTKEFDSFESMSKSDSIFQSRYIYYTFQRTKNYFPVLIDVRKDENKIEGSLLSTLQKEYNNILGFFTSRSIILGGPVFPKENTEILDAILKKYNKYIKTKAIYSQFRNLREFSENEKITFKKNGYNFEDHLDIIHDLTLPINEQWLRVHKGRRKNIRRAEKQGVTFREIKDINEFDGAYQLVKNTYNRVKLPMPHKSLFYESFHTLTKDNILKVFIAEFDNKIIATRMVLCYNNLIYDWYAGSDTNFLNKYPNDFLPWKVLEWGSKNGYKNFTFGGAGKPDVPYGVRDYKLKFGGKIVNYGRFQKNHYPIIFNIMSSALYLYRKYFG